MTRARADFALYRRLAEQVGRQWPQLGLLALIDLLLTPLALLTPLPIKLAVDSAIGHRPLPGVLASTLPPAAQSQEAVLAIAAGLVVAIALLTQLQALGSAVLRASVGEQLALRLRTRLFQHAQRLSLAYHDGRGTADCTYRLQYDALAIQFITIDGVLPALAAISTVAGMIYVTARIDGQLVVVALAVVPLLFLLLRTSRWRMRQQSREVKRLESAALAVVQEVLSSLRVVKAFGQEDRENRRFVRRSQEGVRARLHLALSEGIFGMLVGLAIALGMATVLYVGVHHVQQGLLTLGELLLVLGYLTQLYQPVSIASRKAASLQTHFASAERVFAMLDQSPDVSERQGARPIWRASGAVGFRGVSFAYGEDRPILEGISFKVPAGARVAISGTTGAGKTTLVSLLTRFYDPTAGQIVLDGVDLRDYRLTDLRDQFAIVLQEPVLFSTTVAENIAYGRPLASSRDIVAASRAAGAAEFIERLPDGYDTQVGERGLALSGGERQRISLARAFLKDAPILILDEPTSAVDSRTEGVILDAMERLMRGRTTFIIAHRETTLRGCDLRLRLEHGRLGGRPRRRPAARRRWRAPAARRTAHGT